MIEAERKHMLARIYYVLLKNTIIISSVKHEGENCLVYL